MPHVQKLCKRRNYVFNNKAAPKRMFLTLMLISSFSTTSASAEIKFAILPRLSPTELYIMFKPLEEYLSKEVGENVSLVITKDFTEFAKIVETGQVDLGFANSLVYVQIKKNSDIKPLAMASEPSRVLNSAGLLSPGRTAISTELKISKGKSFPLLKRLPLPDTSYKCSCFITQGWIFTKTLRYYPLRKDMTRSPIQF